MYKLTVRDTKTGEEQVKEFESAEVAILYRDYHLTFGLWSSKTKWVSEDDLKEEDKPHIVVKKYVDSSSGRKVFFKITDNFEIVLKKDDRSESADFWRTFREKRNLFLEKTDWSQLPDVELSVEVRKEYRAYRNYLRVLPTLHNNSSIKYANVYSFEEWKSGKR